MRRYPFRFLFSQLSAIAVFAAALLVGAVALRTVFAPPGAQATGWSAVATMTALAALFVFAVLAMFLWGKVLVRLGVLTAEEARGYPYSKPWERGRSGTA
jgi:hypothetical protein